MVGKRPGRGPRTEAWCCYALAGWVGLTFLLLPAGRQVFPGYQLWRLFHFAGLYPALSFYFLGSYLNRREASGVVPVKLLLGLLPFLTAGLTFKLLFGQISPLTDAITQVWSPVFSAVCFGVLTALLTMLVLNDYVVEGVIKVFSKLFVGLWDEGSGPQLTSSFDESDFATAREEPLPWLAPPLEHGGSSGRGSEAVEPTVPPPPPAWVGPDPGLEIVGNDDGEGEEMPWQGGEGQSQEGIDDAGERGQAFEEQNKPQLASSGEVAADVDSPEPLRRPWPQANEKELALFWAKGLSYPRTKRRWVQYKVPVDRLLESSPQQQEPQTKDVDAAGAAVLETLMEFKIEAEITGVSCGPAITQYEILPAPGVKLSRIEALADNIALRLAAPSVRIVAPIPGKRAVGIEIPNAQRQLVPFQDVMNSEVATAAEGEMALPVMLGRGIDGQVQVLDLSQAPHLLVAGATGSGKSVCINVLIASLLSCRAPTQLRLLMVDPKIVELKLYNDIPHLLTPVITDPKQALQALRWCVSEMERRYWLLDHVGARDIKGYNRKVKERGLTLNPMEYVVVIVDEFADLMALTGKEMEALVARMAAMSRAVGMHMVLATQRPSVDVITGLIKANFPTRIAFMVASKVDSRIILDAQGAEHLLGKGDMLFSSTARPNAERMQGAFLSEDEVERIADFVRSQGEPHYVDEILLPEEDEMDGAADGQPDPLYEKALELAVSQGQVSASLLQRRLQIGYNRAARMVERMEGEGVVGPQNGRQPRELLS